MRKFLRILMMLFLAAYTTAGWGKCIRMKGGDYYKGKWYQKSETYKYSEISKDGITLTCGNNISVEYLHSVGSSGASFRLSGGNTFTVTSTKGKIVHIYFSFDNGTIGALSNGAENWKGCSSGSLKLIKTTDSSPARKAYWVNDEKSNPQGVESVSFESDGDDIYMYWIYVWYADPSEDFGSTTVTINATDFHTDQGSASVSATNGANVFWTINGTNPSASNTLSTSNPSTTTIYNSCTVQAYAGKTTNTGSDIDSDDKDDDYKGQSVTVYSDIATKHITKWYDLHPNASGYTTLCHYNNLIVPEGCTAYTYSIADGSTYGLTTAKALHSNGKYTEGQVIPAGQAVVLTAPYKSSDTYNFKNPDYDAFPSYQTKYTTVLTGNSSSSDNDKYSSSDGLYYYLMYRSPTDKTLGFYWANDDGTPLTSNNAHKAWLVLSAGQAAKGFTFYLPDDDSAPTAIGGIRADNTVDSNAPMYNAAGQRVGASYKGIVIQNGRKFIKR